MSEAIVDTPVASVTPVPRIREIAVVGEIHFAGRALVRALLSKGLRARVLCPDDRAEAAVSNLRTASDPENAVRIIHGSVAAKEALAETLKGVYGAVFLSPITMGGRMYRPREHLEDVRRVISVAQSQALRKLVYHSALGADPMSYSLSLREAALAEELVSASNCQDYRVRTGPLMGRGDGFLGEILKAVKTGSFIAGFMGCGSTPIQPIHVDDMARCISRIFIDRPSEINPGVLNLAGPDTTTMLNLADMAEARLGRTKLRIHIPLFLLKLVVSMKPGDLRFKERVGLLFDTFYTEKNDALSLLAPEEKLTTLKQAQEEILLPA